MSLIVMNSKIRKCTCLICFILLSGPSFCQAIISTYIGLLKHFSDTVVSLTSFDNSIINGIENKVFIRTNLFPEKVNVELDNKYFLSKESYYYSLRSPSIDSKEAMTIIIHNFNKDTLFFKTFRIKSLPLPSIFMGHVNLSERKGIRLNDLQMSDSVFIFFSNTLTGSSQWLKIKRMTIGYTYGSYYITHDNIGNKLALKTKRILLGMNPGQQISMSILAESDGSIMKEIPLLYFTIQ
jgi:hypothetical protein